MSENDKKNGLHVKIVCGEPPRPEDGWPASGPQAGRTAKVLLNGEEIPRVVDIGCDFFLDDVATVWLSFRPDSVEVDGVQPHMVMAMLKEKGAEVIRGRSIPEGRAGRAEQVDAQRAARQARHLLRQHAEHWDLDKVMTIIKEHGETGRGQEVEVTDRQDSGVRQFVPAEDQPGDTESGEG